MLTTKLTLFCSVILLLVSLNNQAQNFKNRSRDVELCFGGFSENSEGGDERMIAVLNEVVVTAQEQRGGYTLFRVYDSELNLSDSGLVETKSIVPESVILSQVFSSKNSLFGLAYKTDKEQKINELYVLEFDLKEFRFRTEKQLISSVVGSPYFRDFHHSFIYVDFSNDSSLILVSHKLPTSRGIQSFRLLTFDRDMKLRESHDVTFQLDQGVFMLQGKEWEALEGIRNIYRATGKSAFEIDDYGTIHTYGRYSKDKKQWWTCSIDKGELHYSKIEQNKNLKVRVVEMSHPVNSKDTWLVAWYRNKLTGKTGFVIRNLNVGVTQEPIYLTWDNETLGDFLDWSKSNLNNYNRKEKAIRVFSTHWKSWYELDDNSLVIVMENKIVMQQSSSSKVAPVTVSYSQTWIKDILVTKLSQKGEIIETKVIEKDGQSYTYVDKNFLNVFYVTHFNDKHDEFKEVSELGLRTLSTVFAMRRIDCQNLQMDEDIVLWSQKAEETMSFQPSSFKLNKFGERNYVAWSRYGAKRQMFLFKNLDH